MARRADGAARSAYAKSRRSRSDFDDGRRRRRLDAVTVRDLVEFLIYRVARQQCRARQIWPSSNTKNLTYCHSVNVAMISLLIGKQIGLDDQTIARLVEAALLHDIGQDARAARRREKPRALEKRSAR